MPRSSNDQPFIDLIQSLHIRAPPLFSSAYGSSSDYGPDGYILDVLPARLYKQQISELRDNGWIDDQTSAVLVKANFRSLNDAAIIRADLLFEFTPAGIVLPDLAFHVWRYSDAMDVDERGGNWRDFLECFILVMAGYYFYLQVPSFIG